MYKKGESSWVRWIKKRITHNLNFVSLAQGPTGIGKSWAMLKLAYDIDSTFTIDQVAFDFKGVMEIINAEWFKKKKWKIIIFDEAQTSISNRQWQSKANKLMNYLLSTFRHQNIIFLFTSPYSDFLDSQSMKLLHCVFDCKGWNKKTKKSTMRPKLLQYNSKMKKFYEHSLYAIKKTGTYKLTKWSLSPPPKFLVEPYEKRKKAFTSNLNQEIMNDLIVDTIKKDELTGKSLLDTGTARQRAARRLYVQYEGNLDKVSLELGIKIPAIKKRIGWGDNMVDLNEMVENNKKLLEKTQNQAN